MADDEQSDPPVTPPVTPPEPKGEPVAPPPVVPTIIDQANEAAGRIEKATKQMEVQLQRLEAAAVEKRLGGTADVSVPKTEETDAEYAEKALKGELDDKKA